MYSQLKLGRPQLKPLAGYARSGLPDSSRALILLDPLKYFLLQLFTQLILLAANPKIALLNIEPVLVIPTIV